MNKQTQLANQFKKLHSSKEPLILYNIWDVGGAVALQKAGARAIASSSLSVANSQGYEDGEKIPLKFVLENTKKIAQSVSLPVSIDFEGGYASSTVELKSNIVKLIDAGAIGINFEDQIIGENKLYSIETQSERISAIREAKKEKQVPLFINARTDIFLRKKPSEFEAVDLEHAIERAHSYANAGADGFFVPGLLDKTYIKRLCLYSPIPVNIMLSTDLCASSFVNTGVSRISYGPGPYFDAINSLKEHSKT